VTPATMKTWALPVPALAARAALAIAGCDRDYDQFTENEQAAVEQCQNICDSHGGAKQICLTPKGELRACHRKGEPGRWHCP
jgi:hypothetical protein